MSATPTSDSQRIRSFDRLLIGGNWVAPAEGGSHAVISPVTEEVIGTVPAASNVDMDAAVAAARAAFDHGPWPRMSVADRAAVLRRVHQEFAARIDEMNQAMTEEVGPPLEISAWMHAGANGLWERNAEWAEDFPFEEKRPDEVEGEEVTVFKEPTGVVAAIIPWNGPVSLASLKLAPALVAGCTVILKPPLEGSVPVMILAEALEAAGFPEGVISVLPGDREVGEHLVRNPDVDKVAFTGSTAAGRKIMGICSERVARVGLELGGKSPAIVADDIPLVDFVPPMVAGGVLHSGQVCAALTRILVPRERQDEIAAAVAEQLEAMTVGDTRDPAINLGPLVSERQCERVEGYIALGKEEGARVVTGGGRPEHLDRGWFVEPTLFADVDPSMRIAQEEIFGPVLAMIPFDSIDHAVEIANGTDYGLAGVVFARDVELGRQIVRRVRGGQVGLNAQFFCLVAPFGGFKQSGIGRESGPEGIASFLETKVVRGF